MIAIQATDEALVPFPPRDVWRVLADVAAYPTWWPRVLGLRVLHREPGLVGSAVELRPFGGEPFRCRVEAIEEPRRMSTRYCDGFITGRGEWHLEPSGSGTRVRYELDVRAEGRVVAWLSRVLPLGRLHSILMRRVLRQLAREIEQGAHREGPR